VIILDTNVISEAMRPLPVRSVAAWLRTQVRSNLYLTVVTEAELLFGIARMPVGKRRDETSAAVATVLRQFANNRVLAFGRETSPAYALIATERARLGRPISQFDCVIAAIAHAHGAAVATRDTAGFSGCGVELINPWDFTGS
jgi:hypothetical protein